MYITCLDNEIEKALRTVLKSTSKVSSLPVLQYIHIHTEKNKLILRGTNLELGVEVSIPATVTTEGEMILSPELFLSVVSGAKGNTIELKEISGNLEVKSTTSKTLIKAVKGDDFPTLPTIDNGNTLTINTQTLADGFKSVLFSASNSTVKQELASILVYIEASVLYFVATDSFRLAEKKRSISGDISLSKILIPAKNAQEIIRIIEAIDADGVIVNGERIYSLNVIWAAGVQSSPAAQWLNAEADRAGRVKVNKDLSVPGCEHIYAVGDTVLAEVWKGKPMPGLAPAAKQSGMFVAKHIRADIEGSVPEKEFHYKHYGSLATIGRKAAVADFGTFRMKGALAWWFWGAIHVMFLANLQNRISVMIEWFWAYVTFKRSTRLITETQSTHH